MVPASVFFPMAARVGLTLAFDKIITELAIEEADGDPHARVRLAVNLSRQSAVDEEFVNWLIATLGARAGVAMRMSFEVTEQIAVGSPDEVAALSARLRSLGSSLGIDHCGSRDLALEYLKQIRPNYTKLDGAFITGIDTDEDKQTYVGSLVEIGRAMEIQTIAAMVESEEELAAARDLGIDAAQGDLIGRPELERG